jgi:hypothetical protein
MNGYLTESFDAVDANPTFYTSQVNEPGNPLYFPVKSGNLPRNDYLGVTIAPDGTPWTALVKLLSDTPDSQGYIQSTGFAGRLVAASSLATPDRAKAARLLRRRLGSRRSKLARR